MKLELRDTLDDIFTRYEATRQGDLSARILGEEKNARFIAAFRAKREESVRPVMEAVGRYLAKKGYEYEIATCDEGFEGYRHDSELKISLYVIRPPRLYGLHEYPSLSVICEKRSKTVRFEARRMWPGGGGGSVRSGRVTIDELTALETEDQILKVLAEVFR